VKGRKEERKKERKVGVKERHIPYRKGEIFL
jgi:hypothetical protein